MHAWAYVSTMIVDVFVLLAVLERRRHTQFASRLFLCVFMCFYSFCLHLFMLFGVHVVGCLVARLHALMCDCLLPCCGPTCCHHSGARLPISLPICGQYVC